MYLLRWQGDRGDARAQCSAWAKARPFLGRAIMAGAGAAARRRGPVRVIALLVVGVALYGVLCVVFSRYNADLCENSAFRVRVTSEFTHGDAEDARGILFEEESPYM